jgi:cytochrome bd-type quinol oxidase subunit 2
VNSYDYRNREEQLRSYKVQIVFSFFTILALLISISVIKDLYFQTKYNTKSGENLIYQKSKLSSTIVLIAAFYFVYISFKTYQKDKTNNNFYFLIASLLALIAAYIRYININNQDVTNITDTL